MRCNISIRVTEYGNVGLQGKIRTKGEQIFIHERRYVNYQQDVRKNNNKDTIRSNNERVEYLYVSICGKHGCRGKTTEYY